MPREILPPIVVMTIVTIANLEEVAQNLRKQGGQILIANPGPGSFPESIIDVSIDLFGHAKIKGEWLTTRRGMKIVDGKYEQTGWEDDRNYLLRPIPEPTGNASWDSARGLFKSLKLEDQYEFKIGFQSTVGCNSLCKKGMSIYVPPEISMREAMTLSLGQFIGTINAALEKKGGTFRLTPRHLDDIVSYVLRDLETGNVLKDNVGAGIEADKMTEPRY